MLSCAAGLVPAFAGSWGRDGHDLILGRALSMLPDAERTFYSGRRAELARWMAEPDKHHSLPLESCRHWLDLEKLSPEYVARLKSAAASACPRGCADEHLRDIALQIDSAYFKIFPPPFGPERARSLWDSLPVLYRDFRATYGELETAIGSVVYQPELYAAALVQARAAGDARAAAKFAGLLAHYAADAFEPFHLTADYRGQYSGNLYFRHSERGDAHARFETGFIRARREKIAQALSASPGDPAPPPPGGITARVIASSRLAYGLLPALIEADRQACERADPRRKWNAYLREADPVFMDIAARQMAAASRLLAGIFLASGPWVDSAVSPLSGNMESP